MISYFEIFLIAIGLSMDAFAVSVANGFSMKKIKLNIALKIALFFGGFQALMPIIGYLSGLTFRSYISSYSHWVAFVVLVFIGGKMIYESNIIEEAEKETAEKTEIKTIILLGLAIATSIDALAVGVSLSLLIENIFFPAFFIGVVTFLFSFFGVYIGKKFGSYFESKVEIIGGIILILIGIKILLEKLLIDFGILGG